MSSPWPLRVLAAAGLLVPAGLHVDYVLHDARLPRDLGLFYERLPQVHAALAGGEGPTLEQALRPLLHRTGGWYELFLALWLRVFGLSVEAFQAVDVLALVLLLCLCGLVGRALARPRAGVLALVLAGGLPYVSIFPRMSWIHVVEAVLVLGAALPWLRDPTLGRARAVAATIACGALALLLRPSALPWLGPLALAMVVGVQGRRPSWKRLALVAVGWLLAALPALLELQRYLTTKVAARARYAHDVPALGEQLLVGVGVVGGPVALLGLLALWLRGSEARRGPTLLLATWAALPFLLWGLFRAGMDNFTPGFAALAVLGGLGLARLGRVGPVLAVTALLLPTLPRLPGLSTHGGALGQVAAATGMPPKANLQSLYRPYTEFGRDHIAALLAASCPPDQRCRLAVDQGLNVPYSEAPGRLGLYLAGHTRVDVIDLRAAQPTGELDRVHALVHWDCGDRDIAWRQRFPLGMDQLLVLLGDRGFAPLWHKRASTECVVVWFTPGGAPLVEDATLPGDGVRGVAGPGFSAPKGVDPRALGTGEEEDRTAAEEAREMRKPMGHSRARQ
ncbi:MAG: hypothetical protein H6742_01760 [Alphaproteobacteria bacterium]|nr:hypothetical protein [Alphaproteobacteria bacterium]